jgi:4'-phosphopantetheinyl transferase EntD
LIDALLPDTVAVVTGQPGDELRPLFPGEERLVASAVPSRRAEFAAGRACARAALRMLGVTEAAILADEQRAPRWPDGVVGSITHCGGFTAAAVALRRDVALLGIDAELRGALDDTELVVSDGERRRAAAVLGADADRVLFSAKESIFKAWYPATGRWLDFLDVAVAVERDGTFTVEPGEHLSPGDRALLTGLRGRFAVDAQRVFTAVHRRTSFSDR